jgi:hypothetical protein
MVLDQIVDIPSHLNDKRLCELVDVEGNWNWLLLKNWLPANILKKIAAVTPPSDEHGSDERIMPGCSNNNFSVAGMYMYISGYQGESKNMIWRRI